MSLIPADPPLRTTASRAITLAVIFLATVVAVISARPYAGSWNDGSRLATVECLVDYETWAIDESIFVNPALAVQGLPYPAGESALLQRGTQDKMLIDGRYYSDKSPVPALLMAGIYHMLQRTTGLKAREDPALFCYWLTLLSSGVAYIVAVGCFDRLASRLGTASRLTLTFSFALATIALPYTRQVNAHILVLALCCALLLLLTPRTRIPLLVAGTLIGLSYTIDLGLGPVLVLCTAGLVAFRSRTWKAVALLLLAAFPWFFLHHYLNWRIGGTFAPANTQASYFAWPGSPFNASNITGWWAHDSPSDFVGYALDLLFGKRGFLGHNPALFLALPATVILLRRAVAETPEILWAACFCLGGWLVYAITSSNYSGVCCSIRWFVPLLAPGYYLLFVLLRHDPRYGKDVLILTFFGFVIALVSWWKGPWMARMVPGFWFLMGGALLAWLSYRTPWRKS